MEPAKKDLDAEDEDVCLQCNRRRDTDNHALRSATRKVALMTAVCSVLCVLTISACCCSLYIYTRFQGFRQDLVAMVRREQDGTDNLLEEHFTMDFKSMPMYGDPVDEDEYEDEIERVNGLRLRRKKEKKTSKTAERLKGNKKRKCRKKQMKTCDCCKQSLSQYINSKIENERMITDKKIEDELTKMKKNDLTSEKPPTQLDSASEKMKMSYMSAAHYTTYVDETYIDKEFGKLEHDFEKHRPQMSKDVPEWQGTLYRNRTFVTTAAPLTLRFFKEADWMKNSTAFKIFDFDKTTGKFKAKYTGLYHLYAHAQFRISREQGIAMVHRRPSGFEILNVFQCDNITITGFGKPCTLGGIVHVNANDSIEILLRDNNTVLSLERTDLLYFGAYFLRYF